MTRDYADWLERNGWIDITKRRPPMTAQSPETNGFYLVLRHDPSRDSVAQFRMEVWFGSPAGDVRFWARIPAWDFCGYANSPGDPIAPAAHDEARTHDLIQHAPIEASEKAIKKLLDIAESLHRRIAVLEAKR